MGALSSKHPWCNILRVFRLKRTCLFIKAYAELFYKPKKNFLYVGDSHAMHITEKMPLLFSSHQHDGSYCFSLGPRLMHSVAISGFSMPKRTLILFRLATFNVLIISLGEIDCRMYLGSENSDFYKKGDWPELFLEQSIELAQKLRIKNLLILTPVPPSDLALENGMYPRRGNLSSRISATNWLTECIISSNVFQNPKYQYIDLRQILAIGAGSLNPKLTDDGVHANSLGAKIIKKSISKLHFLE